MKKTKFAVISFVLCIFIILNFSGCMYKKANTASTDTSKATTVSNAGDATPGTRAGDKNAEDTSAQTTAAATTKAVEETAVATTAKPSKVPNSSEVECNWSLNVNSTCTGKVNGYNLKFTLQLNANKNGGKSEMGAYNGSVKVSYAYDMNNGNVSGNAVGNGGSPSVAIKLVPYDASKYVDYGLNLKQGELPPLAPLSQPDCMGLGSFSMNGSGTSKEAAGGESWSIGDSKTVEVFYKITVNGGQATVELPSVAPGMEFKGMLTGTPVK